MYVTGHDRYSFRVDSTKIPVNITCVIKSVESHSEHVRVFKQMDKKCFAGFLQRKNRRALPTKISIPIASASIGSHVHCNLAHLIPVQRTWINKKGARPERSSSYNARKGQLAQEQVRGLLVLPDLAKRDGARSVPPLSCGRVPIRCGISACIRGWRRAIHAQINASARTNISFGGKSTTYAASMALREAHHHYRRHRHHHYRLRRHRRHRHQHRRAVAAGALVRPWTYAPSALSRP
jgi:hypothetical protein